MRAALKGDLEFDPTYAEQRVAARRILGWAINRLQEEERHLIPSARSAQHIFREALHFGLVIAPDRRKHRSGCPMECDGFYRICPTGPCSGHCFEEKK